MNLFKPSGQLRPLRGRQIPLIPAITQAVRDGHRRIMVQAPTGFGKTVVAAHLMDRSAAKGRRPIFIAPAIALVEQTLASFEDQGLSDIGVIQAQHHRTDWKAQIQIASRDTLVRRALPEVDFAIVDEAHDQRDSMNAILNGEAWQNKVVIGLSATPWARGLGLHWSKLIVAATMAEMISDGPPAGLCKFKVFSVAHDPDMSKVKTVAGEFAENGSAAVMSDKTIVGDAVETWLRHRQEGNHPGDRTFIYGVNRAHAKVLQEAFAAQGISCGYIDGTSAPMDRERTFKRYRSREDKVLANVGVLVTGVDEDVRCLMDCAPKKSETNFVQAWGRGARLAEGKEFCLGLDHAGNCARLGLPWDIHHEELDSRKPGEKEEGEPEEKIVPKPRKCRKCFAMIPPATKACPVCGDVYAPPNTTKHVSGDLVEFKAKPKAKMDEEQAFYSGLLAIAQSRGFKDGWVSNQYRARFDVWPKGLERIARTPRKEVKEFVEESRRKYLESKKSKPVEEYQGEY